MGVSPQVFALLAPLTMESLSKENKILTIILWD